MKKFELVSIDDHWKSLGWTSDPHCHEWQHGTHIDSLPRFAPMKKFEVTWRFASGYEMKRTSMVLARDSKHAQERVWMLHVDTSQLRRKIEFISVEEVAA